MTTKKKQPVAKKPGATTITLATIGSVVVAILLYVAVIWVFELLDSQASSVKADIIAVLIIAALILGPSILAAIIIGFAIRKKKSGK